MEKKWEWLIKFLLLDDPEGDPNGLEIYVLAGKEKEIQDTIIEMMDHLYPKHKDPMIAYYRDGADRDPMVSQGIYHGRMALWAMLRCADNLSLYRLRRLAH